MPATFDGDNLLIILPSATPVISVAVDLYGDWKEWVKTNSNASDNSKYPKAFDTTGGDPTTEVQAIAPYYFLRNDLGWRIRGPEEDGEVILEGNLFGRDPTLPITVPTLGPYTLLISRLLSSQALVNTVSSGSGLDAAQAAQLEDIHKIHGLDPLDPLTVTPSKRSVASGDIDQDITGDGETTTTVTRNP